MKKPSAIPGHGAAFFWLPAVIVLLGDGFLKHYLRVNHAYQSFSIIKSILNITVVFNTGAAFSLFRGKSAFLVWAAVLFLVFFVIFLRGRRDPTRLFLIAAGLIVGGALSNLYDRVVLGYVVDYIDFRVWPVFNLSDACINVGAGLLIWEEIKRRPQKHEKTS